MSSEKSRQGQLGALLKYLESHGFKFVGRGVHGLVLEKPGYPWIFKIFKQDPYYHMFLDYAIKHQDNPNVPKIKGKMIPIIGKTYLVRMEPLTPIDPNHELITRTEAYFHLDDMPGDTRRWLQSRYPGVWKALEGSQSWDGMLDLHQGNIMMRGNTPVLIDPWAGH